MAFAKYVLRALLMRGTDRVGLLLEPGLTRDVVVWSKCPKRPANALTNLVSSSGPGASIGILDVLLRLGVALRHGVAHLPLQCIEDRVRDEGSHRCTRLYLARGRIDPHH